MQRRWRTIYILSFLFLMSYIDRQLITLVIDPIKYDLLISDVEASLITGLAFALTYSTLAVPLARVADQSSRKAVIGVGVSIWGAMTIACGFASNAITLALARMGVGFGEAALTPNGYALATELFDSSERSRSMSVFVAGSVVGAGASLLFGGVMLAGVGELRAILPPAFARISEWRLLFIVMGVLTIACLFLVLKLTDPPKSMASSEATTSIGVVRDLWSKRRKLAGHFAGVPLLNLVQFGLLGWVPSLLIRTYGWPVSQAGLVIGFTIVVAGGLSVLCAGLVADRLDYRMPGKSLHWLVRMQFASLPFIVLLGAGFGMSVSLLGLFGWTFANSLINIICPVHLQTLAPLRGRAQTGALWLLVVNIVGIGLGPPVVALVSAALGSEERLGSAVILVGVLGTTIGAFIIRYSYSQIFIEGIRSDVTVEGKS